MTLRPFWRYYGGKWRAAPRYQKPEYRTIIEPFAGAAGYSLRYPDRDVILVDKYPVIVELWRYLIAVSPAEILRIPFVEHVDDLPSWVSEGGRILVGFAMNDAAASPRKKLSSGRIKMRDAGSKVEGWSDTKKERVARQVDKIRHWKVIEGEYKDAPDVSATWFVDPPYNNNAGSYYVHSRIDYEALAQWCFQLRGQVTVCENEGATWLPFRTFGSIRAGFSRISSKEVIWTRDSSDSLGLEW